MKTALQFSGGKDSLALLLHLKALWPVIDVIHVDTGDSPDAMKEVVEWAKSVVPSFLTIRTDSVGFRERFGQPDAGMWFNCCAANIYIPMLATIKERGYRQVLRGTKRCDPHVHGVFPGDVHDGVIYTFPIWDWSDRDVEQYLGEALPVPYRHGAIGMPDCKSCPAKEACGGHTRHLWRAA